MAQSIVSKVLEEHAAFCKDLAQRLLNCPRGAHAQTEAELTREHWDWVVCLIAGFMELVDARLADAGIDLKTVEWITSVDEDPNETGSPEEVEDAG